MTTPEEHGKQAEQTMIASFRRSAGDGGVDPPATPGVQCPSCGHRFVPGMAQRVQESTATAAAVRTEYADAAHRWPLHTEAQVTAAWQHFTSDQVVAAETVHERARILAALDRQGRPAPERSVSEALINGARSWDDYREMVRAAVRAAVDQYDGYDGYCWVSILDINDTDVVYSVRGEDLWQASYSITGDVVTLGSAAQVERSYSPSSTAMVEPVGERARIDGAARVLESKGTDAATGQRIFRVQVIVPGDSKNGRRYPESVLRKASPLYEGAKAYDHHRTEEEMNSGTVQGLAGYHRNVTVAESGAIESDLYVLPSAVLVIEALDAALALAAESTTAAPLVGISHDVFATFRPIREGGVQLQEAVDISRVLSADVVSDPAAGGRPTRVVAGGITTEGGTSAGNTEEAAVGPTTVDVLKALADATPEQLAAAGFARTGETTTTTGAPAKTTETAPPEFDKGGWLGGAMIRQKFSETSLPPAMLTDFVGMLPDTVTEAAVDAQLKNLLGVLSITERAAMTQGEPRATVTVGKEAIEKKITGLDLFFQGNHAEGYRSFKQAWQDFTGFRESRLDLDEDPNQVMLRECKPANYSSTGARRRAEALRTSESLQAASWAQVLGDSIHRQMMAVYADPELMGWRKIVSAITPISDFRQNKRARIGGYGLLPVVNEMAPYQPLQSPTDEEAVYSVIKRGGTENLTLEMIANDDIGAIKEIPRLLGLAAAITLYRYVFDMLSTNITCTYDSTALFAVGHANTANPAVLGDSTLAAGRLAMRRQTAYGQDTNFVSPKPKTLIVPSALEQMAFYLTKSALAVPSTPTAAAAGVPNFHTGYDVEVVDYWTDADDWFLAADPARAPMIEMGFYQGRVDPELFTQSDPNNGSMFDNDTVTYKIRHIYAGTPLDHRPFYRGAN